MGERAYDTIAILTGPPACDYSLNCGVLVLYNGPLTDEDFIKKVMTIAEESSEQIDVQFLRVEHLAIKARKQVTRWGFEPQ